MSLTAPTTTPEFAQIIVQQLGGFARLKAFVNAHQFVVCDNDERWIKFRFDGCDRANLLKVILEPDDTYSLEFWLIPHLPSLADDDDDDLDLDDISQLTEPTLVERDELIYCDQLVDRFEAVTGLFLSFASRR